MAKDKKVLFVDCFDTIIYRAIAPENVILIWIDQLSKKLNISMNELKKIWDSIKSIKNNDIAGKREELCFYEVCEQFYLRLLYHHKLDYNGLEFYKICLNLMQDLELSVDRVNNEMIDFLKKKRDESKKIICVSDFYLPKSAIEIIFENLGIFGLFDAIYISSEIGLRKSSGHLYDYLITDLSLRKSDILMIGDNKISDWQVPRKRGIDAYLYKRSAACTELIGVGRAFIGIYDRNIKHGKYFTNYSFVLYEFCRRLYSEVKARKITKIYFFSREGEFFKRLFDQYLRINRYIECVETKYLYVSRKSTLLPSLDNLDEEDFLLIKKDSQNLSVSNFLKKINLYEYLNDMIELDESIDYDMIIPNFFSSNEWKTLKNNFIFREKYEQNRIEQKKNILSYLKSQGLMDGSNVCIVDIGWKGSIQDNLNKILGESYTINGYYYGIIGNVDISLTNRKEGLIFTSVPSVSRYFDIFKIRYRILERLCYASHASCSKYDQLGPVLDEYSENEKKLYNFVKVIQADIENQFIDIKQIEERIPTTSNVWNRSIKNVYRILCLDLTKNRIDQIAYMDKNFNNNFGDIEKNTSASCHVLKNVIKKICSMSFEEIIQKIIIILYRCHLKPIANIIKYISLKFLRIKLNKLV